mgnify:FL=1
MKSTPLPEECKHEHIGWYGGMGEPQTCSECRKTINEIVHQSYEQGKKEMGEKTIEWMTKQGYEGLQKEFNNSLTYQEEKV